MVDSHAMWDVGAPPPAVLGCQCPVCVAAARQAFAADGIGAAEVSGHSLFAGATVGSGVQSAEILAQGTYADGAISYSGNRNVDAVLIGSKWTSTNLTFSFPETTASYGSGYDFGQADNIIGFNPAQQAAARAAFKMIEGYTKLTFTEVPAQEDGGERPTFRLAQTDSYFVQSAMGYFPGHQGGTAGDIWFGRTDQPYYAAPEKGNWGFATIMHEIGHTMGLKHGMDDYGEFDLSGLFGVTSPLHGTAALDYKNDGQLWSLMTYNISPDVTVAFNGDEVDNAQSYMVYDIAALQYLYGANFATQSGDTTYRWSETTGEKFINGVGQGAPAGNKVLETIWDGGGVDTYDFSAYTGDVSIDLRPGGVSTLPPEQTPNANGWIDGNAPMQGSLVNALLYQGDTRSLIENAMGGNGDDRLIGNQVNNFLIGNDGDDFLRGGAGSDTLIGGAGSDTASFEDATTGITVDLRGGNAVIVRNGTDTDLIVGIENLVGTAFDDKLTGTSGNNTLSGGSGGLDTLVGGAGDDRLIGGGYQLLQLDRPDLVKSLTDLAGSADIAINLDGSFDLAVRKGVEDPSTIPHATVVATSDTGADFYRFSGTTGAAVILDIDDASDFTTLSLLDADGNVLATNTLVTKSDDGSRAGGDPYIAFVLPTDGIYYVKVSGGFGSDFFAETTYRLNVSVEGAATAAPELVSTASAVMDGGSGNDMLIATVGDDRIDGGSGTDTVSYEQAYRGVTVDLAVTSAQNTGAGRDTIVNVENLDGSRHADVLSGTNRANVINGGGGNDELHGRGGIDTLTFAGQAKGVTFDLALQGTQQTTRLGEKVLADGFEDLTGTDQADILSGDTGANTLSGGAGDDILSTDTRGIVSQAKDVLDGGSGIDTASFAGYSAAIEATLRQDNSGRGSVTANGIGIATLIGMENLTGGSGNDRLTGDGLANVLMGGAGNDVLTGNAGDDTLWGGAGNDRILGGLGVDTVAVGDGGATIDLVRNTLTGAAEGTDTLNSVENVRTGAGNDIVIGNAGDNVFYDMGGDDSYTGGGGIDTVDYSSMTTFVRVDLSRTGAQATAASGNDTFSGIENIVAGQRDSLLIGSDGVNTLVGGAGYDLLIGGAGADVLRGGDGDDLLIGDSAAGALADGSMPGDRLEGGQGNDYLVGGQGDDILLGGSGNDFIVSGIRKFSNFGDFYTAGALVKVDGGNDVIDGGDGFDRAQLLYYGHTGNLTLDMRDADATNILYENGVAVGSIASIEEFRFEGGSGNDVVHGGYGYDALVGGAGNDYLDGGVGDDVINGGAGNDVLIGGEGFDTLSYADATSGIALDMRITTAQDTGGGGIDTISGFEIVETTAYSDTIYGSDNGITIFDSFGGDDHFIGGAGSDYLIASRPPEVAGNQIHIEGGAGDDTVGYLGGIAPASWTSDFNYAYADNALLEGGDGNDYLTAWGAKLATMVGGAGNDQFAIGIGGSTDSWAYDITMGQGRDLLFPQFLDANAAAVERSNFIVRDFATGSEGDAIVISSLLTESTVGYDPTTNPFATGYIRLVQNGNDTLLQMDRDGAAGTENDFVTLFRFLGTQVRAFSADQFLSLDGNTFLGIDPWGTAPAQEHQAFVDLSQMHAAQELYNFATNHVPIV